MHRRILAGLVFAGCTGLNPAWDGASGSAGATSGGASTGAQATGGAPTEAVTTSGGGGGSSGGDASTSGAVVGSTSADGTTSAASTSEAGSDGTTGGTSKCTGSELVPVDAPVADTGVVPASFGSPCPWGGQDCEVLNFGKTEFYRLVNDPAGVNAALIRFETESLAAAAEKVGVDPDDVVGARLELVVWQALAAPDRDFDLEIHALAMANTIFAQGNKDAEPAKDNDSSWECRTREGGACLTWADGMSALTGSTSLGLLRVTAAMVAAHDKDALSMEYHAQLLSDPLPDATKVFADRPPVFAVTMQSQRLLGEQVAGIKFKEPMMWADPTLYLEVCTMWAP